MAVYEYRDESGVLLVKKKRFENKSFEFGRDWDGQWIPGTNGAEIPLYRADELAKADTERELWICEGEKDADRLHGLGLLATTVPCGALGKGQTWKPAYSRLVRRFDHAVLCEDNDASGRANVAECGQALRSLGIPDIRAVTFRDLPEHADVSDWLDRGRTAEQLIELADQAPQWNPPGWPDPIPLTDVHGLPDFPTRVLPEWFRNHVEAVATEIQTARAVPAMVDLAAIAAALARKVAVHIKDNWTQPLNDYWLTALPPANMKTAAMNMALAPLEVWERAKAASMKAEIVGAENQRKNLEARIRGARKKIERTESESDRRVLIAETERLSRELAEFQLPHAPQLVAGDVTDESLGSLLMQNGGRIGVFSDEGGPLKNMAGRYQKNGMPMFETFKHGHDAGTVRVNRIGREPVHVTLASITLGLMVQPSLLRGLKDIPEFRGEGLLARFWYALPESYVGRREADPPGLPQHVADAYRTAVTALLDLPPGSDDRGAPAPHIMEITAEARTRVIAFIAEMEPRLSPGGDLSHVADWAGKLRGRVVRLAAILHLAGLARTQEPWCKPLTADAIDAALTLVREFFIPHGLAAFSLVSSGPESELAEEILAWIRRHGLSRFSKRDLHRHLRRQVCSPKDWDAPLALLIEHGWIRQVPGEANPRGGRPSMEYEVNPDAFAERGAS